MSQPASLTSLGPRVLLALAVGLVVGLLNGLGCGRSSRAAADMTLGTGLVIAGSLLVISLNVSHQGPPAVLTSVRFLGSGKLLGIIPVSAFLWGAIALIVIVGLRQTGYGRLILRGRRQPGGLPAGRRPRWLVLLVTFIPSAAS